MPSRLPPCRGVRLTRCAHRRPASAPRLDRWHRGCTVAAGGALASAGGPVRWCEPAGRPHRASASRRNPSRPGVPRPPGPKEEAMNMRAIAKLMPLGMILALAWPGARPVAAEDEVAARVARSLEVYQELVQAPDRAIPEPLEKNCKCVAIFPHVVKGAFVFGARRGKGVVSCRDSQGRWSPPAFFTLSGGSWGLQIGAEASDVVLFFMTERGAKSL